VSSETISPYYVIAYEPGAENPSIPTWATRTENPAMLEESDVSERVAFKKIDEVPSAFQLLHVLSQDECEGLINVSEGMGYIEDASVSLGRDVRHNDNVVWVVDDTTERLIWKRVAPLLQQQLAVSGGRKPLGLNARFRFYRYGVNDFFKFHTDGAWPGSRVVNGELIGNAYPDRYSMMTFLLLLSEDFEGGATRFRLRSGGTVDIRTPAGAALCFPHGMHPHHCIHSGETVTKGTKYIIRTDILYEI